MTDRVADPTPIWLCSECEQGAPMDKWGTVLGEDGQPDCDSAVCPNCGFEHFDDDNSYVDEVLP